MHPAALSPHLAPPPGVALSWPLKAGNFLLFQAAWCAAVMGAAQGAPALGTLAVALAILCHLYLAPRPAQELRLIGAVTLTGLAYEMLRLPAGDVIYASGQPYAFLPPYWLIALWALLACALNVSMRWIRNRPLVAALCGLLGGPASFLAGVRLGAAQFVDMQAALFALAAGWCFMLPLLGWLATRYDGYAPAPPHPRSASALTEEA